MLPFSAAKVLCGVPPGGKAAAERPVQVEAAAASGAVQRFTHEVQPRTALNWKVGSTSVRASPPPVVCACRQPQGVSPSNRQCLAVRASFCQLPAGRAWGAVSGKAAAAQRARPSLPCKSPSQNAAAVSSASSGARAANRAASSVSGTAGKRSSSTAGCFGLRPGASRPDSCMMQMPESP